MSIASLHVLGNGVRLLLDPISHLMTTSVGVWVQAGARQERPEENGIAHLLEHLVFKGAGGRDARTLVEEAEGHGIYLNAATGYERTGFFARCLGDQVPLALQLCADLVLHPHLNVGDLELEKGVILQEIGEAFDDAEDRCGVVHQMAAFPTHALGRPILGDADSLSAINLEAIHAFRARTYAPNKIMIAASGKIDPQAIIEQVERAFGGLSATTTGHTGDANDTLTTPDPARQTQQLGEVRDSEQTHLMFSLAGPNAGSDSAIAARLMCEILGGGMASRLFQDLRETRGLVYHVEAFCDLYADTGRLCVAAACKPAVAQDVARRVADHLIALADTGPSPGEVARAQNILEASVMMGAESPVARCEGGVGQVFLHGRPLPLTEISTRLRAVTPDAIQAIARNALTQKSTAAASAIGPKQGLTASKAFAEAMGG
ncbi:MAG: hypothetical protein RLZZ157_1076 [Pseudomonadota bacterium]|jgi:predicted Zn-dependent peptidase